MMKSHQIYHNRWRLLLEAHTWSSDPSVTPRGEQGGPAASMLKDLWLGFKTGGPGNAGKACTCLLLCPDIH